jgi:hypothetical protein
VPIHGHAADLDVARRLHAFPVEVRDADPGTSFGPSPRSARPTPPP